MTLHIEIDEDAEEVNILVDDHLSLKATRISPALVAFKNFDALVDDEQYRAIKSVAERLLLLTN